MTFERTAPFNLLAPLPPVDSIIYDRKVLLLLAKAHRSLGKLEGISRKLPNPMKLILSRKDMVMRISWTNQNITSGFLFWDYVMFKPLKE